MKNTLKLIILCSSIILSFTNVVKADDVAEPRVDVKCYVELVGGGERIILWKIRPSLLFDLSTSLAGQEIDMVLSNTFSTRATIYRTNQCILAENEFSDTRAREMDRLMPR